MAVDVKSSDWESLITDKKNSVQLIFGLLGVHTI